MARSHNCIQMEFTATKIILYLIIIIAKMKNIN